MNDLISRAMTSAITNRTGSSRQNARLRRALRSVARPVRGGSAVLSGAAMPAMGELCSPALVWLSPSSFTLGSELIPAGFGAGCGAVPPRGDDPLKPPRLGRLRRPCDGANHAAGVTG